MSAPVLSALGERLRERTAPLAPTDADHGYVHAHLCEALMLMLGQVAEVWDPEDPVPPGAPLLDPALCPDWALPWVAQLVGVQLPAGATPEQARTLITSVSGWKRGTPAALRAAAGLYLTGDKTVYFRERDPTAPDPPYTLEVSPAVRTRPPTLERCCGRSWPQSPVDWSSNYRTVQGRDYQEMTAEGGPYSAQSAQFSTYRHLANNEPVI